MWQKIKEFFFESSHYILFNCKNSIESKDDFVKLTIDSFDLKLLMSLIHFLAYSTFWFDQPKTVKILLSNDAAYAQNQKTEEKCQHSKKSYRNRDFYPIYINFRPEIMEKVATIVRPLLGIVLLQQRPHGSLVCSFRGPAEYFQIKRKQSYSVLGKDFFWIGHVICFRPAQASNMQLK